MPIIKHIPIYAAPKRLLSYVTNEKKTEKTLITGINCSEKADEAYEDMKLNFEMYSGERFFKRSVSSETAETQKQKIRLHHYIQSFKPGEVTPEEAHRIGVEWAERVFGKDRMVLCATHTDKGHIHNHFAVCPYDMYGKHWHANKSTMKMCRAVSDEIALAHGLKIIEKPKKSCCHKYGEYKARKEGRSWKQKLCDEIDMLIVQDNVRNIDDLVNELKAKGYGINRGKYLAIKVKPNRKAIRSYRLGDGYALEHLEYRIEHKNLEMPLSEALKYSGIQREYALCIRQIQIQLYRRPEPECLHIATYREDERTSRLLFYLQEKQIHSSEDFQKFVVSANGKFENLRTEKSELLQKIADTEKMIEEIPEYLEILNRKPLLPKDIKELAKFSHLKNATVTSLDDVQKLKSQIEDMKKSLISLEKELKNAYSEKKTANEFYALYENRRKTDYEILLEQAKAEMENIRREEERQKAERERSDARQEKNSHGRGTTGLLI